MPMPQKPQWYKSNFLKGNLSNYHTMLITNKQVGNEFGVGGFKELMLSAWIVLSY